MTDVDFAELLRKERERSLQQRAELQRSFDDIVEDSESQNLDDEHDPDGATVAFERAQIAALLDQVRRRLLAVDEAERRLQEGTFGRCERCGGPIATERLQALPLATTCVNC